MRLLVALALAVCCVAVLGQVEILTAMSSLSLTVDAYILAAKALIGFFGTVKTVTFQRVIALGIDTYQKDSQVLKLEKIPLDSAPQLAHGIANVYNFTADMEDVLLGLEYVEYDYRWVASSVVFSPSNNDQYRALSVYKFVDRNASLATFIVVDVQSSLTLSPDLLVIHTHTSSLGGFFQNDKYQFERIPHDVTVDDAKKLIDFLNLAMMEALSSVLPSSSTASSVLI
eukprot:TRINITY_DN10524_c0_g1_i1.p1 TRINITY_DN10524_c0_g1~~TRINITY_DN10524_c0_g1_i1.p1  ORF type:complete len:228 (-),score=60.23 TRINITY_DN10524_c0_g1_i1:103-786(-)